MACALYLSGLARLYADTGEERYRASADSALETLSSLHNPHGGWGLGFAYWGLAPDTPYAITTALACRALADHHLVSGSRRSLAQLIESADWLVRGLPWSFSGAGAGPWFAPGMPDILPNVTSMVGGVLHQAHILSGRREFLRPAREAVTFVLGAQRAEGHWTYGYLSGKPAGGVRPADVVDTVHTAYILDGLNLALRWGPETVPVRAAVRRGANFARRFLIRSDGTCLEKVVPIDPDDPQSATLLDRPQLTSHPLGSGRLLVSFPTESRLWGYGALLGALARAHAAGLSPLDAADGILRRLLEVHLTDPTGRFRYLSNDRRAFPRHEAHAFEGVCAMLGRSSTTPATATVPASLRA